MRGDPESEYLKRGDSDWEDKILFLRGIRVEGNLCVRCPQNAQLVYCEARIGPIRVVRPRQRTAFDTCIAFFVPSFFMEIYNVATLHFYGTVGYAYACEARFFDQAFNRATAPILPLAPAPKIPPAPARSKKRKFRSKKGKFGGSTVGEMWVQKKGQFPVSTTRPFHHPPFPPPALA